MKWFFLLSAIFPCLSCTFLSGDALAKPSVLQITGVDPYFAALATKNGYPTETHQVTTEDGYILTIFRMVKGKKCQGPINKTPVIIMHGLLSSADDFINPGPEIGTAYLVADQCYDVWVGNARGTKYGRQHVNYTVVPDSGEFWNFSFDEHGMYDCKGIVDYVLSTTKAEKVSYIGHSQGTTMFWILTSSMPEYNKKFAVMIALAPVAWLRDITNVGYRVLGALSGEVQSALKIGGSRLIANPENPLLIILKAICEVVTELCRDAIVPIATGGDPTEIPIDVLRVVLADDPQPTSLKNMEHFAQGVNVDKFRHYDYGKEENMKKYGTAEPPDYDVTKIKVPVVLIAAEGDNTADIKDVAKLRAKLPNVVNYTELGLDYGHVHYLLAQNVQTKVMPIITEYLAKYCS